VLFLALVAVGQTGALYDKKGELLEARGAAAADLRAPSAQIARVKAERHARDRAEKKISAALKALGLTDVTPAILEAATTSDVRYGSDGSVELKLQLSTKGLDLKR
jgi:hypothetical protein